MRLTTYQHLLFFCGCFVRFPAPYFPHRPLSASSEDVFIVLQQGVVFLFLSLSASLSLSLCLCNLVWRNVTGLHWALTSGLITQSGLPPYLHREYIPESSDSNSWVRRWGELWLELFLEVIAAKAMYRLHKIVLIDVKKSFCFLLVCLFVFCSTVTNCFSQTFVE